MQFILSLISSSLCRLSQETGRHQINPASLDHVTSGSNIRHVNTHSLPWILHMYTCVFGSDVACCIGITVFEGNKCTQTNN